MNDTITPTFVPELNNPVASARSRCGNHCPIALIDAGKFPASAAPRKNRATAKPIVPRASAVSIDIVDHATSAMARPSLHPHRVDDAAGDRRERRVRRREGELDPAVVGLAPVHLPLEHRLEDAQRLAVDVVDRGGEEQQAADPPAQAGDVRGRGRETRASRAPARVPRGDLWVKSERTWEISGRVGAVRKRLPRTGQSRGIRARATALR